VYWCILSLALSMRTTHTGPASDNILCVKLVAKREKR